MLAARGRKVMARLETAAHVCAHTHSHTHMHTRLVMIEKESFAILSGELPKLRSSVSHGFFFFSTKSRGRACELGASEWACGGLWKAAASVETWVLFSEVSQPQWNPSVGGQSVTVPLTTSQRDRSYVPGCCGCG